jgi:hypothetical protein
VDFLTPLPPLNNSTTRTPITMNTLLLLYQTTTDILQVLFSWPYNPDPDANYSFITLWHGTNPDLHETKKHFLSKKLLGTVHLLPTVSWKMLILCSVTVEKGKDNKFRIIDLAWGKFQAIYPMQYLSPAITINPKRWMQFQRVSHHFKFDLDTWGKTGS